MACAGPASVQRRACSEIASCFSKAHCRESVRRRLRSCIGCPTSLQAGFFVVFWVIVDASLLIDSVSGCHELYIRREAAAMWNGRELLRYLCEGITKENQKKEQLWT